jgi:hypothetical protein
MGRACFVHETNLRLRTPHTCRPSAPQCVVPDLMTCEAYIGTARHGEPRLGVERPERRLSDQSYAAGNRP